MIVRLKESVQVVVRVIKECVVNDELSTVLANFLWIFF